MRTLLLTLSLLAALSARALPYPKHEVRAVWLTTIGGLDWPRSYAHTPSGVERQKAALCQTLDRLCSAGINTVLLQTRIRATALFPTDADTGHEPWDGCLSGQPGQGPGYDALAYAIDECHRRGMELHAWVVTIPVGRWNATGCRHLRQSVPTLLYRIGDEGYMNPAAAGTATYLARYCASLARRYDLDGIHLDYIRYPEAQKLLPPPDEGRRNITRIVRAIHAAVKAVKPWVALSCSPIGKHDDTRRFWSHGWNARSRVFQDAKAWLAEGLMDAEFPMMYFRGQNFYPFAVDWQEGCAGRVMSPGLAAYMLDRREGDWPLSDITRELCVLRALGLGQCFFRSRFVTDDTKGLLTFLRQELNRYPALPPPMTWLSTATPTAPASLTVRLGQDSTYVTWGAARDTSGGPYLTYTLYRSPTYPVDTRRAENIVATRLCGQRLTLAGQQRGFFAVTASTRYGLESPTRQEPPAATPQGMRPAWWWVTRQATGTVGRR